MGTFKTPGVYIVEKNAFPNSVVEVTTAVPAFIGYTGMAMNKGLDLTGKPWRISSMAEFQHYFGGAPTEKYVRFKLAKQDGVAPAAAPGAAPAPATANIVPLAARDMAPLDIGGDKYTLVQSSGFYLLYYSMLHFFQNGGGACYIVSVGPYSADPGLQIDSSLFGKALEALQKESEPTMIVMPEAVLLESGPCYTLQQAAIRHCGTVMKNRVAILDVWEGYRNRDDPAIDVIEQFRGQIGTDALSFGAAYYPWLNTTVVQERELSQLNIDAGSDLPQAAISPHCHTILAEMARRLNVLPPAAAMAGVYTMVDNARGVWKAPANVSLNSVASPAVPITHAQQEDLNVTTQGKSINALRGFIGEGTLVWGARTLDGNSLDWRYINVRRTMIMLEESIRLASKAMVFEANVENTWVMLKSMINNFLTSIWKRGGLSGAAAQDAFSVHVGLGETMTPEDILEGILRVTVLVAISRPAEFLEISFQQQMQKS